MVDSKGQGTFVQFQRKEGNGQFIIQILILLLYLAGLPPTLWEHDSSQGIKEIPTGILLCAEASGSFSEVHPGKSRHKASQYYISISFLPLVSLQRHWDDPLCQQTLKIPIRDKTPYFPLGLGDYVLFTSYPQHSIKCLSSDRCFVYLVHKRINGWKTSDLHSSLLSN